MANAVNWFELPSNDFNRAVDFYNKVMDTELQPMESNGMQMAFFPHNDNGVGGAVTKGNGSDPNANGSLVYLNGGDDLATPLGRVESAGGTVVLPKTAIGENGFIAMFMDCEGNKVGLHSMN